MPSQLVQMRRCRFVSPLFDSVLTITLHYATLHDYFQRLYWLKSMFPLECPGDCWGSILK